jgi:hypothetical protein
MFYKKNKTDETFASVMQKENSIQRFNEVEKYIYSLNNSKPEKPNYY